jgi:uncharacterized protein YbjT (DUF2867 family)
MELIMYAICGAAGNTGKNVAETLLKHGKKVRAIGRDAAKLQSLVDLGAEAAIGSLEDPSFVKRAFSGAEAVYLMIPPNLVVDDFRAYQRKVGENLAAAVKENGVKYAVTLSSIGADRDSGTGPVLGLHWLEEALNIIPGLNVLHLRPTFFMENMLTNISMIKYMNILGSTSPGDALTTMIASKDIGDYAAKRLLALDFSGKDFQDLLGPREISMNEVAAALGKAIGKPDLPYVTFSYEDAKQGMIAGGLKEGMVDLYLELGKGFATGVVKPSRPRDKKSTTPTTIEDFSKAFAAAYNR